MDENSAQRQASIHRDLACALAGSDRRWPSQAGSHPETGWKVRRIFSNLPARCRSRVSGEKMVHSLPTSCRPTTSAAALDIARSAFSDRFRRLFIRCRRRPRSACSRRSRALLTRLRDAACCGWFCNSVSGVIQQANQIHRPSHLRIGRNTTRKSRNSCSAALIRV